MSFGLDNDDGFTVVQNKKPKANFGFSSILNSDSEDDDKINMDKLNELEHCINILNKMEEHIRDLWDSVIVPYLENYNERQILDQLTVNDYDKFYVYMTRNNEVYKHVLFMIKYLEELE